MKLRNKKTGKIGILAMNSNDGEIEIVVLEPDMPLCGNSIIGRYDTLSELNEDWEDYTAQKSRIKDKKIDYLEIKRLVKEAMREAEEERVKRLAQYYAEFCKEV